MGKLRYYFPILSLISVSFLVYLNALRGGFVWDDMVLIVDNEGIRKWGCFWEDFTRDFFDTTDDIIDFKYGYYRPIISLSYMADYVLWGLNPWGFHLSNIIFHTICGILVYLIFNLLFDNRYTSLAASLLFVCHPIHTESVTWISGRTDVVAAIFFLSAFYFYQRTIHIPPSSLLTGKKWQRKDIPEKTNLTGDPLRYDLAGPTPNPPPYEGGDRGGDLKTFRQFLNQGKIYYTCSLVFFAIAMLCKEMVATLPFLLIAYTCYFAGLRGKRRFAASLLMSAPYFFVLLLYGVTRFVILKISTVVNPGGEEMEGIYPTAVSFIKTIFLYGGKLLYPVHLRDRKSVV